MCCARENPPAAERLGPQTGGRFGESHGLAELPRAFCGNDLSPAMSAPAAAAKGSIPHDPPASTFSPSAASLREARAFGKAQSRRTSGLRPDSSGKGVENGGGMRVKTSVCRGTRLICGEMPVSAGKSRPFICCGARPAGASSRRATGVVPGSARSLRELPESAFRSAQAAEKGSRRAAEGCPQADRVRPALPDPLAHA